MRNLRIFKSQTNFEEYMSGLKEQTVFPNISFIDETTEVKFRSLLPNIDTEGYVTTFINDKIYKKEARLFSYIVNDFLEGYSSELTEPVVYLDLANATIDIYLYQTRKTFSIAEEPLYINYLSKITNFCNEEGTPICTLSLYPDYMTFEKTIKPGSSTTLSSTLYFETKVFNEEQFYPAGTIVLANDNGERDYLSLEDYTIQKDALDKTPIGIVVVPNTHTIDRKGRMMSLDLMSVDNPDTGSKTGSFQVDDADTQFEYGCHDITANNPNVYDGGIPNIFSQGEQRIYQFNAHGGALSTNLTPDKNYEYLRVSNPYDTTVWYYNSSRIKGYVPSPYINDIDVNKFYFQKSDCGTYDMNGKSNTEWLLDESRTYAQANWKTDAILENKWNVGYNAPACATWRYHTIGTKQGDWFLPSIGELGYIAVRAKEIQESLDAVNGFKFTYSSWPNSSALTLLSFWSSTNTNDISPAQHYILNLYFGGIDADNGNKYGTNPVLTHCVVAFSNALL